jgi:hypothetical protein
MHEAHSSQVESIGFRVVVSQTSLITLHSNSTLKAQLMVLE